MTGDCHARFCERPEVRFLQSTRQYFCGETYFQFEQPFDPSEFVHFRGRIGASGAEKLLKLSISLFSAREVNEKEVLIDTTVQEKNITFPTDTKLHKEVIEGCWKIAAKEGIMLRQSYKRVLGQLMIDQRQIGRASCRERV